MLDLDCFVDLGFCVVHFIQQVQRCFEVSQSLQFLFRTFINSQFSFENPAVEESHDRFQKFKVVFKRIFFGSLLKI